MYPSNLIVALALHELHCNHTSKRSTDQCITQYKIFLAQELGLLLNIKYRFEFNGPWSDDLINVSNDILGASDYIDNVRFKYKYQKIIDCVNILETDDYDSMFKLNELLRYKLFTTIAYLYKHGYDNEKYIIENDIARLQSHFNIDQIVMAFNIYVEMKNTIKEYEEIIK